TRRELTSGRLAAGVDPREFGLESIAVSGWYVPAWERELLETTWNAVLLDCYGVTEANGDERWFNLCQRYHFDFTVIPESLDPETLEPIDEGIGCMVLTGLYPFNQGIPKIRYFIGDLVEVGAATCGSSERAVRFLSRMRDAVGRPGAYRLFSS